MVNTDLKVLDTAPTSGLPCGGRISFKQYVSLHLNEMNELSEYKEKWEGSKRFQVRGKKKTFTSQQMLLQDKYN